MIPLLDYSDPASRERFTSLLGNLRLDVRSLLADDSELASKSVRVRAILQDVARRGDDAVVDSARQFDDPSFAAGQIRVSAGELAAAAARIPRPLQDAMRRSIDQVRDYQTKIMPVQTTYQARPGVNLGLRFNPIDSVGLYVPGGKASYPSSLIMLAVPAQVAGVKRIAMVTPAGPHGGNDLVYAVAHELKLVDVFRAGGVAGIGALAIGTKTIAAVDKIVGPGNTFVQLAKRMVSAAVGVDGFLGPSEILTIADESCRPDFVAADLLAQAEHDPGRCILLTRSIAVARAVLSEIDRQMKSLKRTEAILNALAIDSAIVLCASDDEMEELANRVAAEHVNLQVRTPSDWIGRIRHAGAIFIGPHSPVAAGDYLAGPSHCLPTNTTARFGGGISVYEFLKRAGMVEYTSEGLSADAGSIVAMAGCEGLDAHAASISIRVNKP
jgi:histidinol dehydrogenase